MTDGNALDDVVHDAVANRFVLQRGDPASSPIAETETARRCCTPKSVPICAAGGSGAASCSRPCTGREPSG
jgi:hypothetical protein